MTTSQKSKMTALFVESSQNVKSKSVRSVAEEKSLRELRRTLMLTQAYMADALGIGQESISRLEKRNDVLLSTLHNYVKAMGGELQLVAEFPDRPPVVLKKLGDCGHQANSEVTKLASVSADHKCRKV